MAYWITHSIIADMLMDVLPDLDRRGFAVGSIMPDCNLENADWTAFDPPREVTHYMRGEKKTSADPDAFYDEFLRERAVSSEEERSFLLGYYAHLITDKRYMLFIREPGRVEACYARLKKDPLLRERLSGHEETYDTLKLVFGKKTIETDIVWQEQEYLREHPQGCYMTVLRPLSSFPEYLPHFPHNAAARKISVMIPKAEPEISRPAFVFFTQEEYQKYLVETAEAIRQRILERQSGI